MFHGPWHAFLLKIYLIVSLNLWKLWHDNFWSLDEKNHSNIKRDLAENTRIFPVWWKIHANSSFRCFSDIYIYENQNKCQNIQILVKSIRFLQNHSSVFLFFPLNNDNLVVFALPLYSLKGFAHINSDSVSLPAPSTHNDGNLGVVAPATGLRTVV